MKIRRTAAAYFAIQAFAVFGWWATLFLFPSTRKHFVLEANSESSLMAFWLADILFLGVGSLMAGWLCFRGDRYAQIVSWFVTGNVSYAATYCFAFALITDQGWLGVTLMFPAMIWSGVFSVGITFERTMFRRAAETSTRWILLKTFTQIVVIWSVILAVFPYLITLVEDKLGIERIQFSYQKPISIVIFLCVSSLGIWAAIVMSSVGKGTPLPLDHAKHFVAVGPYALVRNPMALSGVGQGLAVALFLGSPLVAIYALMGSLVWQLIFRPLEEDDLTLRFGAEYIDYSKGVKCWIPCFSAYHIDGTADSSNSDGSPLGKI